MGNFYIWSGNEQGLVEYFDPGCLAECSFYDTDLLAQADKWNKIDSARCITQGEWWQYPEKYQGPDITICGPCSSVLDVAWRLFSAHCLNVWDSVITVYQWAGRGQLGRSWSSPAGNIYAALRCPSPVNHPVHGLPVIIGLCLVRAFSELGFPVYLKWPNDLLQNRKKVGGVLVEEKKENVFAGIGVNLNCIPEIFAGDHSSALAVQKLPSSRHMVSPAGCWQRLVRKAVLWYGELVVNEDLQNVAAEVEQVMEFLGEEVQIESGGERFTARILGVDKHLGLRIKSGGEEKVLYSASLL